ncbi:LysR family transcriptional regulator [Gallibacterium anatis]|uniref:LysR family transcriptional regulator n=1 Tax=Gallibacterium anatis TaxID=750 RepID=A0A930Y4Y1_9PAST|nr:LysR family transcriptional regulator [Gallibacterium anatis]
MICSIQQVVKCGFNATSRQTNIPKATISRRIAKLEQQLGVKLLHRTTHSIKLTNAGALYYPSLRRFLEQALATQKQWQSQYEPCSTIRFSCPVEILNSGSIR